MLQFEKTKNNNRYRTFISCSAVGDVCYTETVSTITSATLWSFRTCKRKQGNSWRCCKEEWLNTVNCWNKTANKHFLVKQPTSMHMYTDLSQKWCWKAVTLLSKPKWNITFKVNLKLMLSVPLFQKKIQLTEFFFFKVIHALTLCTYLFTTAWLYCTYN